MHLEGFISLNIHDVNDDNADYRFLVVDVRSTLGICKLE